MSAMQASSSTFQPVLPAIERIRERLGKEKVSAKTEAVEYKPWADFRIYRATKGNIVGLFGLAQMIHDGEGKKATVHEKILAEGVDMHIIVCRIRDAINDRMNRRAK